MATGDWAALKGRPRSASPVAWIAACVVLAGALGAPVLAGDLVAEVRAVVSPVSPMVIQEGGQLTGFSIDLWNAVADRLQVKTVYRVVPGAGDLFNALRANEADVIATGVYYSLERDRGFDFSYPILSSGLQVMVRDSGHGGSEHPVRGLLSLLFSRGMLYWLAAALLLVLVPAHLVWFFDRRNADGVSPAGRYIPGIFQAMAWAAETLLTQGTQSPRHRVARLLAIMWMFVGVVFVAFFTAQLTATLTVNQIRGTINGPDDLPGKVVAALSGSPTADYLASVGAQVRPFTQPDEMYVALLGGQVDAVVTAAAALRYYAAHAGLGKVKVVGPEFQRGDIGFVVGLNSPLRKRIDNALVALREDGTYQRIYTKWLGAD